jgi:hypothetical protein
MLCGMRGKLLETKDVVMEDADAAKRARSGVADT